MKQWLTQLNMITLGLLLSGIVTGFFVLNPMIKKNMGLAKKLSQEKHMLSENQNPSALQKELEGKVEDMTQKISSFDKSSYNNVEGILADLNHFAEESAISLKKIDPMEKIKIVSPENSDLAVWAVPINIKIVCDYKQLLVFLNKIMTSEKFMKVEKIFIQSNSGDIWDHDVQLDMKVPVINS